MLLCSLISGLTNVVAFTIDELGNFYTTLLNAYGNPVKHYGAFDMALKHDQSGPIREMFMRG